MKLETIITDIRNGKLIIENDLELNDINDVVDHIFSDKILDHLPKFLGRSAQSHNLWKSYITSNNTDTVLASVILNLINIDKIASDRKERLTTFKYIHDNGIELFDKELLPKQIEGRNWTESVYIIDEHGDPYAGYYHFGVKQWLDTSNENKIDTEFKWFYVPKYISFD